MDIPPEADADAGLPRSGKYDVSGTILNNFGFLAGFGILPILSVHLIHIPCAYCEITVASNDILLSQMEIPAHIKSGGHIINSAWRRIDIGFALPYHQA